MKPTSPTASAYHRATSYRRHDLTPHHLDWAHQPSLAKAYPSCQRVELDLDPQIPAINYTDLVMQPPGGGEEPCAVLPLKTLSTVLQMTQAITGRQILPSGQPFYYRSVASAGALYPFELYLAVRGVDGLAPGVYHHDLFNGCLTRLQQGSPPLIAPVSQSVVATFFITGIFFRSAWKYRSRAYRYVLLDAGHLLENLRLALRALNLCFSIHLDFDDSQVQRLLGVDGQREVCLVCVHLHGQHDPTKLSTALNTAPMGDDPRARASRVSEREIAYPEILDVHRAGQGSGSQAAKASAPVDTFRCQPTSWIPLEPAPQPAVRDVAEVLRQRRSRRNFVPDDVVPDDWMTFMGLISASLKKTSLMPQACREAVIPGILAGQGLPVPPGVYRLDAQAGRLGVLGNRLSLEAMAAACLDQMWLKHAGLHLLLMTDLAVLERTWGARGYRYAMIEAGRLGQQAYLAATAVGWGACGIGAIYDREAADLLQLTENGVLLYLVAAGPVKKR